MPIGVHTSIAGGLYKSVERAAELGCEAMQIFGRNPRSWIYKPISAIEADLFRKKRQEAGLWPVVIHATYLINLCSPDEDILEKSVSLFKKEVGIAEAIGADYVVTHLGSPQEMGSEFALMRILEALKNTASGGFGKKAQILLENTSGAGYGFGSNLSDIGDILDGAEEFGLYAGLCLDTCHAFTAGYRLETKESVSELVKTIDREIGLKRLKVIHLNDSKGVFESNIDRHEHIGEGKIGIEGFKAIVNHPKLASVPMILETPKKTEDDDPRNLRIVRELKGK
ncbi:MAG: deoxyribonuclease IV [Deltaproteobacteria bacterium]|nr:deoxyribonuclease IV [Deltaproteobacteria bacterium]